MFFLHSILKCVNSAHVVRSWEFRSASSEEIVAIAMRDIHSIPNRRFSYLFFCLLNFFTSFLIFAGHNARKLCCKTRPFFLRLSSCGVNIFRTRLAFEIEHFLLDEKKTTGSRVVSSEVVLEIVPYFGLWNRELWCSKWTVSVSTWCRTSHEARIFDFG